MSQKWFNLAIQSLIINISFKYLSSVDISNRIGMVHSLFHGNIRHHSSLPTDRDPHEYRCAVPTLFPQKKLYCFPLHRRPPLHFLPLQPHSRRSAPLVQRLILTIVQAFGIVAMPECNIHSLDNVG